MNVIIEKTFSNQGANDVQIKAVKIQQNNRGKKRSKVKALKYLYIFSGDSLQLLKGFLLHVPHNIFPTSVNYYGHLVAHDLAGETDPYRINYSR